MSPTLLHFAPRGTVGAPERGRLPRTGAVGRCSLRCGSSVDPRNDGLVERCGGRGGKWRTFAATGATEGAPDGRRDARPPRASRPMRPFLPITRTMESETGRTRRFRPTRYARSDQVRPLRPGPMQLGSAPRGPRGPLRLFLPITRAIESGTGRTRWFRPTRHARFDQVRPLRPGTPASTSAGREARRPPAPRLPSAAPDPPPRRARSCPSRPAWDADPREGDPKERPSTRGSASPARIRLLRADRARCARSRTTAPPGTTTGPVPKDRPRGGLWRNCRAATAARDRCACPSARSCGP
ncbi:hypothetical protein ABIC52_001137 [Curtobacterium oceanosedimentum]